MFTQISQKIEFLKMDQVQRLEFQRQNAAHELEMAKNTSDQNIIAMAQQKYDSIAQRYGIVSGEIPQLRN